MLDAGYVQICLLTDSAESGDMPKETLSVEAEQWYEIRSISYDRQYAAKGADEQIDMLIRIWKESVRPRAGQYAYFPASEEQYRITFVSQTVDRDRLDVYDLTLVRLESNYDVECDD